MIVLIIIWIIVSLLIGGAGMDRQIGFWGAFLMSVLLTPIIGLLFVLSSPRNSVIEIEKLQKEKLLKEKLNEESKGNKDNVK